MELKVDDVFIDEEGRGSITITETKKHRTKRTILPEKFILSSASHKSFKNWLDKWRPKVENQYSKDSFYLQPDGKPFAVRTLGRKLSEHGKKVFPPFQPYDMRHWCAVARLIETKIQTGNHDPYAVKNWLGHADIRTTESYIHYAEMYYNQYPHSWLKHALRPHEIGGGKHEPLLCKRSTRNWRFLPTLLRFSPYSQNGPARI